LASLPGFDFFLGCCFSDQSFGLFTNALWLSGDIYVCPMLPGHFIPLGAIYFSGRKYLALLRIMLPVNDIFDLSIVGRKLRGIKQNFKLKGEIYILFFP
jgi:hypothetical protein